MKATASKSKASSNQMNLVARIRSEIVSRPTSATKATITQSSLAVARATADGYENGELQVKNEHTVSIIKTFRMEREEANYHFDHVFDTISSQEQLYEDSIAKHVLDAVDGFNVTIVCTGATRSGKTYTLMGEEYTGTMKTSASVTSPHAASPATNKDDTFTPLPSSCLSSSDGIIPRSLYSIFEKINEVTASNKTADFYVEVSFVELSNRGFSDLLRNYRKKMDGSSAGMNDISSASMASEDGSISSTVASSPHGMWAFERSISNNTSTRIAPPQRTITPRAAALSATSNKGRSGAASPTKQSHQFKFDVIDIYESADLGVFLALPGGNIRMRVQSAPQAIDMLRAGCKLRSNRVVKTDHHVSSRSHAVYTIYIERRSMQGSSDAAKQIRLQDWRCSELLLGKVHMVDLAGSDHPDNSHSTVGDNMQETKFINTSLNAFGDVLRALAKNSSGKESTRQHVPFLNSKLTHLLKDSLGGNCRTVLIANLSNEIQNLKLTASTLKYTAWAKAVTCSKVIKPNRIDISRGTEEKEVEEEGKKLRRILSARSDVLLKKRSMPDLLEETEKELQQLDTEVCNEVLNPMTRAEGTILLGIDHGSMSGSYDGAEVCHNSNEISFDIPPISDARDSSTSVLHPIIIDTSRSPITVDVEQKVSVTDEISHGNTDASEEDHAKKEGEKEEGHVSAQSSSLIDHGNDAADVHAVVNNSDDTFHNETHELYESTVEEMVTAPDSPRRRNRFCGLFCG